MSKNVIIGAALTVFTGILIDYGNCPGVATSFGFLTAIQWVRTVYLTSEVDNWY